MATVSAFHNLRENINMLPRTSQPQRASIFSDCAFIVSDEIQEAAKVAIHLMRLFLQFEVPVRMALAGGTFHAHRFSSDTTIDTTLKGTKRMLVTATPSINPKGVGVTVIVSATWRIAKAFDSPQEGAGLLGLDQGAEQEDSGEQASL